MSNSVKVKLLGGTPGQSFPGLDFICTLIGEDLEIQNNSNTAYIPQIKNKTIHLFSNHFSIGDVTFATSSSQRYDWDALIKFLKEKVHNQPAPAPSASAEQGGGNRRRTHRRSK